MTEKKARSMAGLPWIAAMAFFMQALDATILNTALPAIAHSLNRSPLAMQSAIISYTLTVAMLIPVSGWLADRFGTRRVFMLAVSLFTLGSLACALSSSLTELVIFRVIQGIGGAMMMPVARLALLRAYPRSELLPVLNFVTMPGLIRHLGNVALDFPHLHTDWRCWDAVCPKIYAELHHATQTLRFLRLSALRAKPGAVLHRYGAARGANRIGLGGLNDSPAQHHSIAGLYPPCAQTPYAADFAVAIQNAHLFCRHCG